MTREVSERGVFCSLLMVSFAVSQVACMASHQAEAVPSHADVPRTERELSQEEETPPALIAATGPTFGREAPRRVGDRLVHRYSGTYRDEPLVVLEQVVAIKGDVLVVDYQVLEGDEDLHLRVEMTTQSERIMKVSRVSAEGVVPTDREQLTRLMQKTSFSADRNDGLVARRSQTCLVGPQEFDCQVSQFEVEVAGEPATLLVARHPALLRDVAGEVVAVDGTVLYKADLIEFDRGDGSSATDSSVALGDSVDWARQPD